MQNISNSPHLIDQYVLDLESKLNDKLNAHNIVAQLLLVASSMITYYGEKYKFYVYDTILNTNYIIDNYSDFKLAHTIRDVLSKNVYEYHSNNVMSICNIEKGFNSDLSDYRATYSLCITNRCVSDLDLLEGLIRELNKIFLSKNHTFITLDNKVVLRNGISSTYLSDTNSFEDKKTINDVISYLQIEDILRVTKSLKYNGNNKELNKLLNNIKNYDMDNIILDCCLPLVNLFRPLFSLEYVKGLLNINMFEGNIDNICNEFDSILGHGSFDRMSKKLDKLYEDFYNGTLGANVSEYNISKEYVSIRDNFINKYIKKKYAC